MIYALYSDLCTIEPRDFGTSAERTIAEGSDNPKIYSIDLNGDFTNFIVIQKVLVNLLN